MLILARKVGESLMIGEEIEIKIVELSGEQVKVGIEAPRQYRIMRRELCMTRGSNIEAAKGTASKQAFLSFLSAYDLEDEKMDKSKDGQKNETKVAHED